MAYSSNGNNFPDKILSRVKYDLEYDSSGDLYRFKGKPPEIIKVVNVVANDIFFDSGDDFEPVWFDSTALEYIYGDQVFFDVFNNKNLVVLDTVLTGDCLSDMEDFIKYKYWPIESGFWDDGGTWLDSETWND